MKKLVDEIVDQMARLPTVDACYQTSAAVSAKEFRQIKMNAVIKEAEHIRMNKIFL